MRCALCQHGTCSWRGTATCKPGQYMVEPIYTAKGTRGRPKQPKANSGRKGHAGDRKFNVTESLAYKGLANQANMSNAVKKRFADLPLGRTLLVRCKPRKSTKKGIKCVSFCKTHHDRVTLEKCKWAGCASIITMPVESMQLKLKYQSDDMHAPHELQLYGTLNLALLIHMPICLFGV